MRGVTRGALAGVAVAGLAAGSIALVPAAADATPGSGATGVIQAQWTIGQTDYTLRKITLAPGGTTGWHYHPGEKGLKAWVLAGTLTHSDHTCKTDGVYRTGAFFTEMAGTGNVHEGRNLGKTPVVLEVLYELPKGAPLSEDAPNPGCPFQ